MIIPPTIKIFAVGVDLGMAAESTAFAVVERLKPPGWDAGRDCPPEKAALHVRQLRRFPPGTQYVEIATNLADLLRSQEFTATTERTVYGTVREISVQVHLVLDQTAVGTPVTEMILEKAGRPLARRVVISGNHTETYSEGFYLIPKQTLIGRLEVLLETTRLKFAGGLPETRHLADELVKYRGRTTVNRVLTVDTWREQPADDLVFAVALACWRLQQPQFQYEFI